MIPIPETAEKKPKVLTPEEIDALAVTYLGPTWKKTKKGKWKLPKYTLGWQILDWCATYLNNFDGSPNLQLTREQARFILWWYAIDEDGRFLHSRGVLQRLKGWGKDPIIAVIAMVEFVGPSRFDHWDENGNPVAIPHPNAWVQVAAVSREQTRNTMTLFPQLVSQLAIETFGIKMSAEILRAHEGRQRIEAVTSSYRALEGGRSTFVVLNETQHWVQGNNGIKMYETVDGNATKMNSRYLAITNAYLPGEDSVAERMRTNYNKIDAGMVADFGFMYDSIEAHPKTPLTPEALRIVIPKIRGDASWLNVEAIIQSVLQLTISPARSRRMYLNQIVASEDALYGPEDWEPLEVKGAKLKPGDEIVLGFDGGKTDDSTCLVAVRAHDQVAFVLGLWERPDNWPTHKDAPKWLVPRRDVDIAVRHAFNAFKVLGFYADVNLWEPYITDWEDDFAGVLQVKSGEKHPIGWDMRQSEQKVTRAHERLLQAIYDGKVHHDGDPKLRIHVLNAFRHENTYGVYFKKEAPDSPRKVDLYAALMLAWTALNDLRVRPTKPKRQTTGFFM